MAAQNNNLRLATDLGHNVLNESAITNENTQKEKFTLPDNWSPDDVFKYVTSNMDDLFDLAGDDPAIETDMSDPTREEIDAKLAAVEARTETRFVELTGKIDRLADSVISGNTHVTAELSRISTDLRETKAETKSDNKFTRWTIVVAVVTSLIAGGGALWVTQSNMLASFLAGIAIHDAKAPEPPPPVINTPGTKPAGSG